MLILPISRMFNKLFSHDYRFQRDRSFVSSLLLNTVLKLKFDSDICML